MMESMRVGDERLALAIATALAIGALSWGLSLSKPPRDRTEPVESVSDAPAKPANGKKSKKSKAPPRRVGSWGGETKRGG